MRDEVKKLLIGTLFLGFSFTTNAIESNQWEASDPNNIAITDDIGTAHILNVEEKEKMFAFYPKDSIQLGYSCPTENNTQEAYVKVNGIMDEKVFRFQKME